MMYLSGNGGFSVEGKLGGASKVTLNPNATEFIPLALKSSTAGNCALEASSKLAASVASAPGKVVFDRSESSISFTSEDEAQFYWQDQLPDDITPDFTVMGVGDGAQGINKLSFSGLSLTDINEGSRFAASKGSCFPLKVRQEVSALPVNGNSLMEKLVYPISSSREYPLRTDYHTSLAKTLDQQITNNNDQILVRQGPYIGNKRNSFLIDLSNEQLLMANLDVDGGLDSKASSPRSLTAMDFPAFSLQVGHGLPQNGSPYQSPRNQRTQFCRSNSFIPPVCSTEFASVSSKMTSQDSSIWKYETNSSSEASIGSDRSSQVLTSSFTGSPGRGIYNEGLQNRRFAHPSQMWLETGDDVANMYSNMRGEACDNVHVRNAYFEQARRAYLIGNKALAKELSLKGQLHNMRMKAAHAKAQEPVYHQWNSGLQANGRERMIDLHGLHLMEAIHVLKLELAVLRNASRSLDQRLIIYICVGTSHNTLGSRLPTRLMAAIQRYLLEEEGLDYSEPQPGILGVII